MPDPGTQTSETTRRELTSSDSPLSDRDSRLEDHGLKDAVPGSSLWPAVLTAAAFAMLWADLIRQLSFNWLADEQYAYGCFVPVLALGLLIKRWSTRPPADPGSAAGPDGRHSWGSLALMIITAILLVPIRVIHEINQDWPLVSWPLAAGIVGISLYGVYLAGGKPWVRHFAFPVCFMLVAVRWPDRFEVPLTQGLMRLVAVISVEALDWLDVPAVRHGNLIELSAGTVGVNEACSGIRSLQSTVMAALFMGELYFFRWPFRLLLLVTGVLIAFALNVGRALFLAWQGSASGLEAIGKWHDRAGFTIVIICFACLWILAWLFRMLNKRSTTELEFHAASQPAQSGRQDGAPPIPPRVQRFGLAVGCWIIGTVAGTELWYRVRPTSHATGIRWSVSLPETRPAFENLQFTGRTLELLDYDTGVGGKWPEPGGAEWTAYFCQWRNKSVQSIANAASHRPEICLPAAGFRRVSDSGVEYISAGTLKLPFRKSTYSAGGRLQYVFDCLWQEGDERRDTMRTLGRADRLEWAWAGRKSFGLQTLELILSGYPSLEAAESALREKLPGLIRIANRPADGLPATARP